VESEIASLRRVVEELRAELRTSRAEPQGSASDLTPAALRLVRRLVQRGVDNSLADELARACVRDAASPREPDMLEALEGILRRSCSRPAPPGSAASAGCWR
jgi:hypothetical protein